MEGIGINQILWGIVSFLFVISFFFVKSWKANIDKDMDKIKLKMDSKISERTCIERHSGVKEDTKALFKHKHSNPGGEVIIP